MIRGIGTIIVVAALCWIFWMTKEWLTKKKNK